MGNDRCESWLTQYDLKPMLCLLDKLEPYDQHRTQTYYQVGNVATLTLGSWLSVECNGPWGEENVFRCEKHFHKWGRVQGMEPNDSQVHSHFGNHTRAGVVNIQSLGWKGNKYQIGPQDTIRKALKWKCLKCPHIVHLDIIYMNYDQKKGHESNWKFDFWPQTPWK